MNTDFIWLQSLVPDVLKTIRQRYLILVQVANLAPVGRRTVAKKLGLSERSLRTETDYLKQLGLLTIDRRGMSLTDKGSRTLAQVRPLVENFFKAGQHERQLERMFNIDRAIIVPGDLDREPGTIDLCANELNAALDLLLPLGKSVITVLDGHTMAHLARFLSPRLSNYRELMFVPGRGAIGDNAELQCNTIAQVSAQATHGKYRALYLPESVSEAAYRSLIHDEAIVSVLSDISHTDAVIHSIGRAPDMIARRYLTPFQKSRLLAKGAVGECFGCFFDQAGNLVEQIPSIGLQLQNLHRIPHIFTVAAGHSKAAAIKSYMHRAPRQTWLITDEGASKQILKGQ
ncbi:MAG: sugar-binding transcriptional regulator [Lactobacillus sp.]